MEDCIFCRIMEGKMAGDIVHETGGVVVIKDIHPQAPVHLLIMPRRHIATINDLTVDDGDVITECVLVAKELAGRDAAMEPGYRLVWNVGGHGGQAVYHIHLHLLGGRRMTWPPG